MTAPLLVVGHGTRSAAGVEAFTALVRRAASRAVMRGVHVEGGFIELAPPPVTDAVSRIVAAGHSHVVAVPLVLVAAGHGKGDIPGAMMREQVRHPGLTYAYGRPLGPHPVLQEVLAQRVDAARGDVPRSSCTVVLVGRGSTDPDANAEVAKVARLLFEGREFASVEQAFVSLAVPSVTEGLERARLLGGSHIVVAPYFLFPGVLPDRIDEQTSAYAAEHPELDIRVAGLIGDCDELADLVLERYAEAIAGDIRMNCDTCIYRLPIVGFEKRAGEVQRPHDHPDDSTVHHHAQHTAHSHA